MRRLRLAVLWASGPLLIAAGIATSWADALQTLEWMSSQTFDAPGFRWGDVLGVLTVPLYTSGFVAVLIAIVTHWALWRPPPREP